MISSWRGSVLAAGRGAAPFAVILIAWALVTRAGVLPAIFLPPLGDVAKTAWQMLLDGSLWTNILASVGRVLIEYRVFGFAYMRTASIFSALICPAASTRPVTRSMRVSNTNPPQRS